MSTENLKFVIYRTIATENNNTSSYEMVVWGSLSLSILYTMTILFSGLSTPLLETGTVVQRQYSDSALQACEFGLQCAYVKTVQGPIIMCDGTAIIIIQYQAVAYDLSTLPTCMPGCPAADFSLSGLVLSPSPQLSSSLTDSYLYLLTPVATDPPSCLKQYLNR